MKEQDKGTKREQQQDFGFFLSGISHSIQQYFNRVYDDYGITYPQSRLLTYLIRTEQEAEEEGRTSSTNQRELERALGIKASSVSSLVRNLEARGFVTSGRVESDTRNKRIVLTEKGRMLDEVMARAVEETENHLMEGMTTEEHAQLLGLLARLNENASRLSE